MANKKSPSKKKSTKPSSKPSSSLMTVGIVVIVVIAAFVVGRILSSPSTSDSGTAVQQTSSTPSNGQNAGGWEDVSPAQAKQLIDENKVQLVDVREKFEYDAGHVKGAELMPVESIGNLSGKLDKSKPVLVYCATGARSSDAAGTLVSRGFKKVYNMTGGMADWTYAVEK